MRISKIYSKKTKRVAIFLLVVMVWQSIMAPVAFALTSGPTQPEVMSFGQVGVTDMVDVFTGDFSYNIPLFELPGPNGGYPFNLVYNAGVGMDQEASWVGLGWNLNAGSISRQVRGLPDEFKGDVITTTRSIKPNKTFGVGAGVSLELFGLDPKKGGFGLGFSVFHNSYKGIGYSIDSNFGLRKAIGSKETAGVGVGLNVSLNSQEGVSTGLSLDVSSEFASGYEGALSQRASLGTDLSYNSQTGFSSNLSVTHTTTNTYASTKEGKDLKMSKSASSTLPLGKHAYTPSVGLPMKNISLTAQVKFGAGGFGVFGNGYALGYYNEQKIKDDKQPIGAPAYGYMNEQFKAEENALLDFNRVKDGVIKEETPNLAIPSHTYDIFSLTGQDVGGAFRAFRTDVGTFGDPKVESITSGGSLGVDLGPPGHFGVNATINSATSVSEMWSNSFSSSNSYQAYSENDAYEPWFYSTLGNMTVNDLSDEQGAVRVKLSDDKTTTTSLVQENGSVVSIPVSQDRVARNQLISSVTNKELLQNGTEVLSLFKLDIPGFSRSSFPEHHMAGYQVVNQEGLRYTYALPAYNYHQEEVQFSVARPDSIQSRVNGGSGDGLPAHNVQNTDEYLSKTETPEYPYAYLLTSIVGQDYVDVTGDGVTEDDLGYWVKFTYTQKASKSDPYKWRAPFLQVNYFPGFNTDTEDDRGSYTYGEKGVWYLEKAETRSHIATFSISVRDDAKGANARLQDTGGLGKSSYKLDEIVLYTRSAGETMPIKRVKFEYSNDLCQGIENGNSGKLTLKKLWFEYGSSSRGALNPYEFDYHESDPLENPDYDMYAVDRWGNYKPYTYYSDNYDFPYVDQLPEDRVQVDVQAGAWCLKEIGLPSGGKMLVDYEADDYGYVQNRQAMQMTKMEDPYSALTSLQNKYNLTDGDLKVRFKLEHTIEGALSSNEQKTEVLKYLDSETKQLYFKARVNLRSDGEAAEEFVSGYADIDFNAEMGLEQSVSGTYDYGYFHLKAEDGRHPISLRAWQHLRVNQPELIGIMGKLKDYGSDGEKVKKIRSLGSIIPQVQSVFQGFYDFASSKGWGRTVKASKTWMRLKSPDRIKAGGGNRVKQITLKDEWADGEEGIYGQYYQYTRMDGSDTISSGVANNEPEIGGDENALRYAKKYTESVPLRSDNNLFFEYPLNESYYPGAQVGYEQVEVMSLASAAQAGITLAHINLSDGKPLFPSKQGAHYGVTGLVKHEFYSSREYPVLTDETSIQPEKHRLNIPIFGIGTISEDRLAVSQGYSITTNDMHGKPKKVTYYGQNDDGTINSAPVSWVKYNYQTKPVVRNGKKFEEADNRMKYDETSNTLSVITDADLSNPSTKYKSLGYEQEVFSDMRLYKDEMTEGGISLNTEVFFFLFIVVPALVPIPSATHITTELRSSVTNKIIRKSGILLSTEAFDGQSVTTTTNTRWDAETGQVVLKTVTNNFEKPIYSLDVLAYQQYEGMGPSYRNQGLQFTMSAISAVAGKPHTYKAAINSTVTGLLYNGDKIIVLDGNGSAVGNAIYLGNENGDHLFYSRTTLSGNYSGKVWRSGRRNLLTARAGNIIALEDPMQAGTNVSFNKTLTVPVNGNE